MTLVKLGEDGSPMSLLYRTYTPFPGVEPIVYTQPFNTFRLRGEINMDCSLNIVSHGYNHQVLT